MSGRELLLILLDRASGSYTFMVKKKYKNDDKHIVYESIILKVSKCIYV